MVSKKLLMATTAALIMTVGTTAGAAAQERHEMSGGQMGTGAATAGHMNAGVGGNHFSGNAAANVRASTSQTGRLSSNSGLANRTLSGREHFEHGRHAARYGEERFDHNHYAAHYNHARFEHHAYAQRYGRVEHEQRYTAGYDRDRFYGRRHRGWGWGGYGLGVGVADEGWGYGDYYDYAPGYSAAYYDYGPGYAYDYSPGYTFGVGFAPYNCGRW